ncbi:MAG: hypothetical protein HQ546_04990 [Planctomycetes bacterium]|nr:hypothetical protein [Planctomycetota bacterium]
MRKLLSLLIVCALCLGSYHFGRLPNSPDILGWLTVHAQRINWSATGRKVTEAVDMGRGKVSSWFASKESSGERSLTPAPAVDRDNQLQANGETPSAVPQCW